MIRTLLTVKKNGIIVHRDYSKSFTKHFVEALYLSHSQILTGAPLTVTDVGGNTTRQVDGDSGAPLIPYNLPKSSLQVASPCGNGTITLYNGGYGSGTSEPLTARGSLRFGYNIGIVIGRGNVAVTPTDFQLGDLIAHGVRGSNAGPILIDNQTVDSNSFSLDNPTGYMGMVYRPIRTCLMTQVQFKAYRNGNPGNVTCKIFGMRSLSTNSITCETTPIATSNIVNANLWGAVSPGALVPFPFASPVLLLAGHDYFFGINPSGDGIGDYVVLRYNLVSTSGSNSSLTTANPIGSNFSVLNNYYPVVFEIDGGFGAEMEYGGTDIYGYTVANPNASFTMRRIFMNNSGEAITVRECGIYLPTTRMITGCSPNSLDMNNFILCAARDIIAGGVTVNNGESLEIDYTPSITV